MTVRILLGLSAALLTFISGAARAEPVYRGKNLSQHLLALRAPDKAQRLEAASAFHEMRLADPAALAGLAAALRDKDEEVRQAAAAALVASGAAAIPFLTKALEDADAVVRAEAVDALRHMVPRPRIATAALSRALKDPNEQVRSKAALALGRLGPATPRVVPALIEALRDSEPARRSATRALGNIGPSARDAASALAALLKEKKDGEAAPLALDAAEALGRMGPAARPASPALREALRCDEPQLQLWAAWALLAIGEDACAVTPTLIALLGGKEPTHRMEAARLLGWIGPEARPAIPALVRLTVTQNYPDGTQAIQALIRIGAPAIPELIQLMPMNNPLGQRRLAAVLKQFGTEAVRPLMHRLDDPRPEIRAGAAQMLEELGHQARAAAPRLEELLFDHNRAVRVAAAEALVQINRRPNLKVLRFLRQVLEDKDRSYQEKGFRILAFSDLPKEWAAPLAMAEFLNHDDAMHWPAQRILESLGPRARLYLPPLGQTLGAKDPKIRGRAFELLCIVGPKPEDVPLLTWALKDVDVDIRRTAVRTLSQLGPTVKEVLPALIAALKDPEEKVREDVIEALGRMGPGAHAATPALIEAIKDEPNSQRALRSLQQIGPVDILSLRKLLRAEAADIRATVAETLAPYVVEADQPLFLEMLKAEDPEIRRAATSHLYRASTPLSAPLHAAALQAALGDKDIEVRKNAVSALKEFGPEMAPILQAALADANSDIRLLAAAGLAQWPEHVEAAVAFILKECQRDPSASSAGVPPGLPEIGAHGKPALPLLRQALRASQDGIRRWAADALGNIGPEAWKALPDLRQALGDLDPDVRLAAAQAWTQIEYRPAAALPILLDGFERERVGFDTFYRYGPDVVLDILKIAQDDDLDFPFGSEGKKEKWIFQDTRERALMLLGDLGQEAAPAVPGLIELLKAQRPLTPPRPQEQADLPGGFAEKIILALGPSDSATGTSMPILMEILRSREFALHPPAAWALG